MFKSKIKKAFSINWKELHSAINHSVVLGLSPFEMSPYLIFLVGLLSYSWPADTGSNWKGKVQVRLSNKTQTFDHSFQKAVDIPRLRSLSVLEMFKNNLSHGKLPTQSPIFKRLEEPFKLMGSSQTALVWSNRNTLAKTAIGDSHAGQKWPKPSQGLWAAEMWGEGSAGGGGVGDSYLIINTVVSARFGSTYTSTLWSIPSAS